MKRLRALGLCLGMGAAAAHGGILYSVNLNTSLLAGHAAGPFGVGFQLADGSGTNDGNNLAVISDVNFGLGGLSTGSPTTFGNAYGDLASTVLLTDGDFVNYFAQSFTPGDRLSFHLFLTTNVDDGGIADTLTMYLLDNTGTPIPTTAGPFFDALAQITLDSDTPTLQTFEGDLSRAPVGGGAAIGIGAPAIEVVPEPGTVLLIAGGIAALYLLRRRAAGSRTASFPIGGLRPREGPNVK